MEYTELSKQVLTDMQVLDQPVLVQMTAKYMLYVCLNELALVHTNKVPKDKVKRLALCFTKDEIRSYEFAMLSIAGYWTNDIETAFSHATGRKSGNAYDEIYAILKNLKGWRFG